MENERLKEEEHHKRIGFCNTRPAYRQGRKLTAVKTYTISSESQHLFIYGVPKINLRNELKSLCSKYGQVMKIHIVEGYKTEMFTECYHIQYQRIQSARIAKRFLDERSFYGGVLHVCYAPEFESVEETKAKLLQRTRDVNNRLFPKNPVAQTTSSSFVGNGTNNAYKNCFDYSIGQPYNLMNGVFGEPSSTQTSTESHQSLQYLNNQGIIARGGEINNSWMSEKCTFERIEPQIPAEYLKVDCENDSNKLIAKGKASAFVPRQVNKRKSEQKFVFKKRMKTTFGS